LRKAGIIVVALALGGCATVTRGLHESVTINSDPPEARATLSNGMVCQATPCTFDVDRKGDFVVAYSKPGFAALSGWVSMPQPARRSSIPRIQFW
jgi:hypothetical protein